MSMNLPPAHAAGPRPRAAHSGGGVLPLVWFALLFLGLSLASAAQAADALATWRAEVRQTRLLAENDASLAYRNAQHLQTSLPADATPADWVRVLNLLSRIEMYLARTDIAAEHAQQALSLAALNGDKVGQVEALLNVNLNAINQAKVDASIAAATRGMDLLEGVEQPDLLGEALLRASMMYLRSGDWNSSITVAMRSLEIAKRGGDAFALAYAHQGMAVSFNQSGNYAQAREHYARMREHARAAHSRMLEGQAIIGLAGVMANMGDKVVGEALMREAIALFRLLKIPFSLSHVLFGLADLLHKQGRHAEAVRVLNEVVAIYEQYPNKIGLWWSLVARSQGHQSLGRVAAARADAQQAYTLAKDIDFSYYRSESAKRMAAIAAAAGDHRGAYLLSVEASNMAEKATRERVGMRMVELAQRYETESKQREIKELTRRNEQQTAELQKRVLQQRWLWSVLGGGALALAGTAYFALRLRRSNRALETLNMQVQRSQNQLQATLEAVPDPLFVLGLDGRYHDFYSPRMDLLAAPTVALLGKKVSDILPSDAADVCMAALHEANEKEVSTGKQFELSLARGPSWFELSVSRKPVFPWHEPRFVVLARDITERKQQEAQEDARRLIFERLAQGGDLQEILGLVVRYVEQAHPEFLVSIMLLDAAREHLTLAAASDISADYLAAINGLAIGEGVGSCGTAAWRGEAVVAEDLRTHPFWSSHQHLTAQAGLLSCWSVPIFNISGEVLGTFGIYRREPGGPSASELELVRRASHLSAIVIERRGMERDLETSHHLLRQLAARNEAVREDERTHISREIHDELGQYLQALRMGVSVVDLHFGAGNMPLQKQTQRLLEMVDATIKVVRNMVAALRPAALDSGIVPALEWLVGEYSGRTGLQFDLQVCEDDVHLDDSCATALFRIVQESLTNVVRHAQASKVTITLMRDEANYLLEVRDNGRGFDPRLRKEKSFGLVSIRERVLMLGGDVNISSAPGQSTAIRVRIPTIEVLSEA